jgi:hypothetical protein
MQEPWVEGVAGYYTTYYKIEGTKTAEYYFHGQNDVTYKKDGGTDTNTDPDQWSAIIGLNSLTGQAGTKYLFGVQSTGYISGGQNVNSEITWSTDPVEKD